MTGVNWEKAYKDLESHIEHILEETSTLIHNTTPELRINEVIHQEKHGLLEVIIDATGHRMEYALYLIDRSGKNATIKLPYQPSNTFLLDVPRGRYTIQAFVYEKEAVNQAISEKVSIKYDRVNSNEQAFEVRGS